MYIHTYILYIYPISFFKMNFLGSAVCIQFKGRRFLFQIKSNVITSYI